jgi:hypothetical protein
MSTTKLRGYCTICTCGYGLIDIFGVQKRFRWVVPTSSEIPYGPQDENQNTNSKYCNTNANFSAVERSLAERFLGGAVVGVVGAAVAGVVVAVVDGMDVLDYVDVVANVEVSDVVLSCRTLPTETDKIDEDCESTMGVVGNAADRGSRWASLGGAIPVGQLRTALFPIVAGAAKIWNVSL